MSDYIEGTYGVAVHKNSEVAQRYPLGWYVKTAPGVRIVAGYSSSAYSGVTGLWVEDLNGDMTRERLEEID